MIPFPFLIFVAGVVAGLAAVANVHFEMQKSAARDAGTPPVIDASELGTYRTFPWFDEVTVRVQMVEDLTYVYWDELADGSTIEYPVMFFVDPAQAQPTREVLGAIAFTSLDWDDVQAYLETAFVEDGPIGSIFELSGVPAFQPIVTYDEIEWAAYDIGAAMAPNFLYLKPHYRGRDLSVAARPELTYIAGGASVLLIWLSLIAAILRRRRCRDAADSTGLRRAAGKGLVAAAGGGAKMLFGEDEDEGYT